MIRVHVICEGQTEEMFVNEVLSKEFDPTKLVLYPSLIGKPGHKGGRVKFERLLTDLRPRLLGDQTAYCTVFFDFYGLPSSFPGKEEAAQRTTTTEKSSSLLQSLDAALKTHFGEAPLRRFIPYVQMHEFEGLLFSDVDALANEIGQVALAESFRQIRAAFPTPEDINDSPMSAPSKRIEAVFSRYEKPFHGSLASLEIGISTIRQECPLFDGWVRRLESLQAIP